jgi:hypothetical protein
MVLFGFVLLVSRARTRVRAMHSSSAAFSFAHAVSLNSFAPRHCRKLINSELQTGPVLAKRSICDLLGSGSSSTLPLPIFPQTYTDTLLSQASPSHQRSVKMPTEAGAFRHARPRPEPRWREGATQPTLPGRSRRGVGWQDAAASGSVWLFGLRMILLPDSVR